MRLLRLRLENYIGIYNGMGLHSIDINFALCMHPITVIKGDNGTGKSTLYKALSPLPDPTIEFIKDMKAYKLISYGLDDGTILIIEYTSDVRANGDRVPTKCAIRRYYPNNDKYINLNPNNNISSGKDIIYNFFGLDDNFLMLSQISASRKGLGGLKPYDRKRYVNSIISQLSDYITMNKLFAKKSMVLKSMVNQFTTKLQQIGNIEQVKSELNKANSDLESCKYLVDKNTKELAILENKVSNVVSSKQSLEEERSKIKSILESIEYNQCEDIDTLMEESQKLMNKYSSDYAIYNSSLSNLLKELESLVEEESSVRNSITEIETKLDSFVDKNTKEQYKNKIDNLTEEIENLQKSYSFMKEKYGFTYEVTQDELEIVKESINIINSRLQEISNKPYFDSSLVEQSMSINKENYEYYITENTNTLSSNNFEIAEVNAKISLLQNYKDRLKLIPKECTLSYKCGLLNVDNKYMGNPEVEIEEKRRKLKELEDINKKLFEVLRHDSCLYKMSLDYTQVLDLINTNHTLKKLFNLDEETIKKSIISQNRLNLDIDSVEQFQNVYVSLNSKIRDRDNLLKEYEKFGNNVEQSVLETKLSMLKDNLNSIWEKKNKKNEEYNSIVVKKGEADANYKKYKDLVDKYKGVFSNCKYKSKLDLLNRYNEITDIFSDLNKDLEYAETCRNTLNRNKEDSDRLEKYIESLKYKCTLYTQYEKDYLQYKDLYCKLETFRKYSSVNGIQTVYMEVFMNSILNTANNLLINLFKGEFTLEPFVINDKEFRIPCIDIEGNLREDISLMSDSQLSMISMIISFALLNKASDSYNIIKLDEVDNNLDNYNRVQFAKLIEQVMIQLNFNQCILISHNNELDLSNTDMILFECGDKEQLSSLENSGANIIFNVNK